MNTKIKVEICCGTTCYMLGGAELMRLEDALPAEWKDRVEVSGASCFDTCVADNLCRAPFVRIDGKLIEKASVEKVLELLRGMIQGEGAAR